MNKLQTQRWNAAKKLFIKLKIAAEKPDVVLMCQSNIISASNIFICDTDGISVVMGNCSFSLFNLMYFDGVDKTIAEFESDIRKQFKIVKDVKW